jgi:hypothetical protein
MSVRPYLIMAGIVASICVLHFATREPSPPDIMQRCEAGEIQACELAAMLAEAMNGGRR